MMRLYLRSTREGRRREVPDLRCGAAIASSSMLTEMIKEKRRRGAGDHESARRDALDGLPAVKIHCSVMRSKP